MSYSNTIKSAACAVALATGLTCTYTDTVKADGLGDTEFIVSTQSGRLNVRQKPTTKAKVVGKLKKGSKVVVTDLKGNSWGKVGNGWVSMSYLKAVSNPEYDKVVEQENQAEAILMSDEANQHNRWVNDGCQFDKRVVECDDTVTLYEHGSDLSKPLLQIPDGTELEVYYTLASSDYSFVSVKNKQGQKLYGYLCWYNISVQ